MLRRSEHAVLSVGVCARDSVYSRRIEHLDDQQLRRVSQTEASRDSTQR